MALACLPPIAQIPLEQPLATAQQGETILIRCSFCTYESCILCFSKVLACAASSSLTALGRPPSARTAPTSRTPASPVLMQTPTHSHTLSTDVQMVGNAEISIFKIVILLYHIARSLSYYYHYFISISAYFQLQLRCSLKVVFLIFF